MRATATSDTQEIVGRGWGHRERWGIVGVRISQVTTRLGGWHPSGHSIQL
jgi:hypothetical protein